MYLKPRLKRTIKKPRNDAPDHGRFLYLSEMMNVLTVRLGCRPDYRRSRRKKMVRTLE